MTPRDPDGKEDRREPDDAAATHPTKDEDQDESERDDAAEEAAEDSFPASDPPSW
jgi:hypothetical protein